MAAAAASHGDMALEVHLPQVVGLVVLKALVGYVLGALGRLDETVSSENGRDGALGGHVVVASVLEHPGEHMTSLGGIHAAEVDDDLLHLPPGAVRGPMGTLRHVIQTLLSPFAVSSQPLVAGLTADPNTQTQLTHVHLFRLGQCNELLTLRHDGFHLPWHGLSPEHVFHAHRCNPCPRTCVTYVPGLYSRQGDFWLVGSSLTVGIVSINLAAGLLRQEAAIEGTSGSLQGA